MTRRTVLCAAVTAALLGPAATAAADVTATRDAAAVAQAIEDAPGTVTAAAFTTLPPFGNPAAVSTTRLGQFPVSGSSYAILSSGDATLVTRPNNAQDTGVDAGGTQQRGARDVTTLRLDFTVPQGLTCASLSFRFYSEEFPEFVGQQYNDAFIAELDESTWSSPADGPGIVAPKNFAYDLRGNPVNVNSVASFQTTRSQALGTTYDAATRRLRASTPVTPGPHSLFLSIFDQGDRIYDSAVFLDRFVVDNLNPCTPGAAVDVSQPTPPGIVQLPNGRLSIPVASVFLPERLDVTHVPGPVKTAGLIRSRAKLPIQFRVRDTRDFLIRNARVRVRVVPSGLVQPVAVKRTARNGQVTFTLRPTAKLRARQRATVVLLVQATKPGAPADASVTGYSLVSVRFGPPR